MARQIFASAVDTTQNGHGQNEVNMKASKPRSFIWLLLVENEQGIELVCRQSRCYHCFKRIYDA